MISTGILNIVAVIGIIFWLGYRSTHNGIKRLLRQKCCTQVISLFLTFLVVGFSVPGITVFSLSFPDAAGADFGLSFWKYWGCGIDSGVEINCDYYYGDNPFCPDNIVSCDGNAQPDVGYFCSTTNIALYFLLCFYSWIGSWCCSCCCPGVEEEVFPTRTLNVNYPPYLEPSSSSSNPLMSTVPMTYTLYIHHGAQFPSKLIVSVSTLEELKSNIMTGLGITVPFKIAIYDDICQQYVMVSSLQLIPHQATIQLLFS